VFQTDIIGERLEKFKALQELKLPINSLLNSPLEGSSNAKHSGRGYNTQNLKFAKEMRKEMTKEEFKLWNILKSNQLNFKFRRQHPIGNFITDFCCLEKKLVIELDGSQHTEQEKYDNQRTVFLNSCGFKVIRFWNNELMKNFNDCVEFIIHCLNEKTPPQISAGDLTLPQGAGYIPTPQEVLGYIYSEGGKSTGRKGMEISSDLTAIQNIIKVLEFTIKKIGEVDNSVSLL
jgi:very-short-patch-repair endonuclease